MARAVFPHELQDQDFSWLINRFQEANPQFVAVEISTLPLVLIRGEAGSMGMALPPAVMAAEGEEDPNQFPGEPE